MRAFALLSALALSACGDRATLPPLPGDAGDPVVVERLIAATPDPALRHCRARPGRPNLRDDADTAVLIANLDERGVDCAAKLAATWAAIDDAVRRAEAATGRQPGD